MAKEKAAEAATAPAPAWLDRVIVVPAATQGDFGTWYGGIEVPVPVAQLAESILVQALTTGITKELQLAIGPEHRRILKDRESGVEVTPEQARDRIRSALEGRLAMWLEGKSGRVRGTEGDPVTRKTRALIQARLVADAKASGKVIAPERLKASVDAALADPSISAPFREDAETIVKAEQAARAQVKSLTAAATARLLNPSA